MEIKTAEHAGFCFGVKRAINKIEEVLSRGEALYALGEPIHNAREIDRLKSLGLAVVKSVSEIPDGAVAFIRAHGVAPDVIEELTRRGIGIEDGTCPFVKVAQMRARELSEKGFHVLILGEAEHPEVKGIVGNVRGPYTVISSEEDLRAEIFAGGNAERNAARDVKSDDELSSIDISKNKLLSRRLTVSTNHIPCGKITKLGMVSQTTQEESVFEALVKRAEDFADELKVFNTVCNATQERQAAVKRLAREVDCMVVIGGKNSANTRRLAEIASAAGCPVQWVERAAELDRGFLEGRSVVGIAAGASTPDWTIEQLKEAILDVR